MSLKSKIIIGVKITIASQHEILEEIEKYLAKREKNGGKPLTIFTPNPEIIMYAQKDQIFKEIVNTAQINLSDGAGVVWAVKKLHGVKIERIAGTRPCMKA